ncbi:MAG: NAD(+) kinase [Gammaproteobacteria bacterium]
MFRPTIFRRIGLVAKPRDARVAATLRVLIDLLTRFEIEIGLDEHCVTLLEDGGSASQATPVGDDCDLVIAVGGDGTLLRAAHLISSYDVRLLGVNMGHLGFLADIPPEEVEELLSAILQGDFVEEKRLILRSTVLRGGQPMERRDAINDVVVHKWGIARLITLDTSVDGDFVHSQRSDGIIVSTPTGSTAYALSCGGPIVHPSLDALVIVPLCPHSLSNRPLVVGGDSRIEIEIKTSEADQARLICDGEIGEVLRPGDRVLIEKGQGRVRLVHPAGHDHFAALRAKLQWG